MRRLLPLALLLSLLVLAGCGGSDDEAGQDDDGRVGGEPSIRVGLIVDQGQLDDNGFNELAFKGLTRAEKELGIEGRVIESASAADYIPNMTTLARDGYDLVIGVGFAQGDAVGKVAQKYPEVSFAIIDVDQAFVPGKPANVAGAALPRAGGRVPRRLPRCADWRRSGARGRGCDQRGRRHEGAARRPLHRRLLRRRREGRAGDRDDPRLLAGLGRPGEVQGAGAEPDRAWLEHRLPGRRRLRPRRAQRGGRARTPGESASTPTSPSSARTSSRARQKGVDSAVFLTIESIQDGSWKGGGNATFGLKEDGVGLGKVSPDVPQEDVDQVEQIKQQIADGEITGIPTEVGAS